MTKDHCNICDKTPADNSKKLWPNQLPEGHRLRDIAIDVRLNPSSRRHNVEEDFHLCRDCWRVLILAVAAGVAQAGEELKAIAEIAGYHPSVQEKLERP